MKKNKRVINSFWVQHENKFRNFLRLGILVSIVFILINFFSPSIHKSRLIDLNKKIAMIEKHNSIRNEEIKQLKENPEALEAKVREMGMKGKTDDTYQRSKINPF